MSVTTQLSQTSKLLDHFAWFLDNAEEADIEQAADLFKEYRRDTGTGLWGAAFVYFALSGKYPDDEQQLRLRMGLAMAANDVARDAPDAEVRFLLDVLEAAGYKPGYSWDKPAKKPVWLHWVDAMDANEALKDVDEEVPKLLVTMRDLVALVEKRLAIGGAA